MSRIERDDTVMEVEAAHAAIGDTGAYPGIAGLSEQLTRVSTRFALRVLELVDFHRMDEELAQGKLDPKFVGPVRRSVPMASPELFPQPLKPRASSLKDSLSALEAALVRNDVVSAKAHSHEAHEKYHELQHEAGNWLQASK